MLRIFYFNKFQKLKTHNNRYQYFKVQTAKDIDQWIDKTNNERLSGTEHDRYLPNYAILNKNGLIELRSILEPGFFLYINEIELQKAIYQYYQITIKDFCVFYSSDRDLDMIQENRGKIICKTSRPIFIKVQKNTHHQQDSFFIRDEIHMKMKNDGFKKYSKSFYYINSKDHQIEFSTAILSLLNKYVVVNKIVSVPLSYVDIYEKFRLNKHNCGEGLFINRAFDVNDNLLIKYA
ncbi:conserved hypothetical protein [Candida dubliniensis CD36]|uniref:Uncharacterized protein n=1 Tax=Candida dubliniensis (strain CD36 / ATCC MYA-646 / CBS 7987 / NCPF 3949 / NRRL Y-17841) TaxID=573826 RepID=B9WMS4_CANDC|nr:conserved hypothetical protein [Candida dubliniensis CD36]CAX40390.1 conserved hypothetical protein [Candida dubliniensis CD36]